MAAGNDTADGVRIRQNSVKATLTFTMIVIVISTELNPVARSRRAEKPVTDARYTRRGSAQKTRDKMLMAAVRYISTLDDMHYTTCRLKQFAAST